ncbi:respiratory nitrate reductase subunit gamma [Azospirillum halopraeferens]|uniref:respiratory nitrate reductase subunit gamma n=1 Tax=Azospirillum halopraeferens TaxID=34010 RepID=UPI0004018737|nr:respiratory nitrate reductase subunit gamma [Azospirillum halopraeferens]
MSVLFALLYYTAAAVFAAGLAYKIHRYATVPAPLKIPTTPAPLTRTGVAFRLAREVGLFESLFRADKLLWALAVLFHLGLLLVALRHLRYVVEPLWFWIVWVQPFGVYGGLAMLAGLTGLLVRRFVIPRIRYITGPSDILMLLLLLGIGVSGFAMSAVARTDIVAVKQFFLGLMVADIRPLPADGFLLLHLFLVAVLAIVFPFSKLLHAPGVFFSPTRNQVDDARERRHVAAWARPLDQQR